MQITLRNTDLSPVQIIFDDDTIISLSPDDELTLQAYMGGSIIMQDGRVQTRGIMAPPYSPSDVDAPGNDPFDDEDDNYDRP